MKELLVIFLLCLVIGCSHQTNNLESIGYAHDSTLCYKDGVIKDSSRFHLPADSFLVTNQNINKIDSFFLKVYSANYKCFKAPVLYNHYLGYDIYRFLWLRSFNRPVLITLTRTNKIILNTKELERFPKYLIEIFPDGIVPIDENAAGLGYHGDDIEKVKKEFPGAAIVKPKYNTKIVLDSSIVLPKSQWEEFLLLIEKCSFWSMKSSEVYKPVVDGAQGILEGHTKTRYHFVKRMYQDDEFGKCLDYLIKLSAVKEERKY